MSIGCKNVIIQRTGCQHTTSVSNKLYRIMVGSGQLTYLECEYGDVCGYRTWVWDTRTSTTTDAFMSVKNKVGQSRTPNI